MREEKKRRENSSECSESRGRECKAGCGGVERCDCEERSWDDRGEYGLQQGGQFGAQVTLCVQRGH